MALELELTIQQLRGSLGHYNTQPLCVCSFQSSPEKDTDILFCVITSRLVMEGFFVARLHNPVFSNDGDYEVVRYLLTPSSPGLDLAAEIQRFPSQVRCSILTEGESPDGFLACVEHDISTLLGSTLESFSNSVTLQGIQDTGNSSFFASSNGTLLLSSPYSVSFLDPIDFFDQDAYGLSGQLSSCNS